MTLEQDDINQIKSAVEEIAEKLSEQTTTKIITAIDNQLIGLGIDANNPLKVQDQMAFLAKASNLANSIVAKVVMACVAIFGAMAVGWAAFEKISKFTKG